MIPSDYTPYVADLLYFGDYLQGVILSNLRFTLMVSSQLLEISINFAKFITTLTMMVFNLMIVN